MNQRIDETFSCFQSDTCQEKGYTDFTDHEVRAWSRIGNNVKLGAETADENRHDQRTTSKTQLDRLRYSGKTYGNASQDASECDSYENRYNIGLVRVILNTALRFDLVMGGDV